MIIDVAVEHPVADAISCPHEFAGFPRVECVRDLIVWSGAVEAKIEAV
jgi:hypothetical protein